MVDAAGGVFAYQREGVLVGRLSTPLGPPSNPVTHSASALAHAPSGVPWPRCPNGHYGWTIASPQIPELIGGRATSDELVADTSEIIEWAKDESQTF